MYNQDIDNSITISVAFNASEEEIEILDEYVPGTNSYKYEVIINHSESTLIEYGYINNERVFISNSEPNKNTYSIREDISRPLDESNQIQRGSGRYGLRLLYWVDVQ